METHLRLKWHKPISIQSYMIEFASLR